MRNDSGLHRSMLRGYMFEIVIMILMEKNGYSRIQSFDNITIRCQRSRFVEVKGRGAWHQIDCPCEYNNFIPFINPLRVLGEVKFLSKKISKELIREYIGLIKDIQENCFIGDNQNRPSQRYTELGIYFAAEGFEKAAENLAFAHNIKTISYKDNYYLERIKEYISVLESDYLPAKKCIAKDRTNNFKDMFYGILNGRLELEGEFKRKYEVSDGCISMISNLSQTLREIRSSFIASTSGGAFIHFLGNDRFPEMLFTDTDTQKCRVHYETVNHNKFFYIIFTEDNEQNRLYFSPPFALKYAAFFGGEALYNAKKELLKTINATIKINGISRNLTFILDTDWLNSIYNTEE